jgi:hypothetical protein
MIRNLKTLGLAVVAVLATSAMVVSMASAAEYHSANAPTTITGSQYSTNAFHVPGAGTLECTTATLHGSLSTTTATELTVHPTYSGCKAFGFATTHVTTIFCDYTFTQPYALQWSEMHVVCSDANLIRITPTVFGGSVCTVTIGSQSPTGYVQFINEGSNVRAIWNMTSVSHSAGCGASAASDGTYTGSVLMQGSNGTISVW